jgi:hypothetical protein
MTQLRRFGMLRVFAVAAAILSTAACVDSLPPRVTCERVRALNPGMKQAEVERLIGAPTFGGTVLEGSPEREWHYEQSSWSSIGMLRFGVIFEGDTVTDIFSYYEYPWMRNAKSIYSVSADRRFESDEFRKFFHCQ